MSVSRASNSNIYKIISDAAGRVGIGTSSPAALLSVNGHVHITSASPVYPTSGVGLELLYNSTSDVSSIVSYSRTGSAYKPVVYDASRHEFQVSGASRVNIATDGVLSVNSGANWDLELQSGYPMGLRFSNAGMWEWKSASDTSEISINYVGYNNGTSYFRDTKIYNGKYGILGMFQGSTGRFGIGTASPTERFQMIDGNFRIDKTSYGGFLKWTQGTASPKAGGWEWGDGTGWRMDFGPSATPRLSIYDNGNVGIGTTSPSGLLTVAGDVHSSPTSGNPYIIIAAPTTGNSANIRWDNVFGTQKWRMTSGDSGASYRFYFLDANDNDGVYIAQNATTWTANSDSRLKDVKETITNAVDKVNQLTGVKYTWKRDADNPDAKTRVGLIAQDVLAVLPEAVDNDTPDLITDEETGKVSGGLGVRYTELVPLLVNAIKELTTRIATLEQRA